MRFKQCLSYCKANRLFYSITYRSRKNCTKIQQLFLNCKAGCAVLLCRIHLYFLVQQIRRFGSARSNTIKTVKKFVWPANDHFAKGSCCRQRKSSFTFAFIQRLITPFVKCTNLLLLFASLFVNYFCFRMLHKLPQMRVMCLKQTENRDMIHTNLVSSSVNTVTSR